MFFLVSSEDADTKGREPPSGSRRHGVEAATLRTAGSGDRDGIRGLVTEGSHDDPEETGSTRSGVVKGREELLE